MAEEQTGQERTEQPTERRLQEARKKGQVPRSKELNTMLSLILRAPEISKQDFDILKKTVFTDDILNSSLTDYGTFLATFRYFFFQLHSLSTF